MGRKFVPQSTIDARIRAKDARLNAAIEAFRMRTRPLKASLPVPVVVEVAIVPVSIDTPPGPVVEVELHPFGDVPPGEPASLPAIDPCATGSARAWFGLTGRRRYQGAK
jgi:hypothetical protein